VSLVTLPNCDRALIDPRKVIGYSLDPEHEEGRHKAHLFDSLVGINRENAKLLLDAIQNAAVSGEAIVGKLDKYGQRYLIDFAFAGPGGTARLRSAWIVRSGEDFPRLVACYIL
jgi:hypothetical protein